MRDTRPPPDWMRVIGDEFDRPYMKDLQRFLQQENDSGATVFPPVADIFSALHKTPFANVHVVILGQDPYHGENQAHGLSFSVRDGIKFPPSLLNIYKEICREYGCALPDTGDLTRWAQQGVLLLNATLTVRMASAGSHQNRGWETFTDAIIRAINDRHEHVVFMLWGAYAQKKGAVIDRARHLVLEAPHPSPLSAHRGFIGCGHFRRANDYLAQHGKPQIDWVSPK